jgi:hypothetical protein
MPYEYMEPVSYKAEVHISGCCIQKFYAKKPEKLRARALRSLTDRKPGWAGTYPVRMDLFKSVRTLSRNRTRWELVETVAFKDIPPSQYEYLKKLPPTS